MKKEKVFDKYRLNVAGLITANVITNFPRGFFNAIIFMIIVGLSSSVLAGKAFDYTLLFKYYYYYLGAFFLYIIFSIFSSINTYVQSYSISSDIRMRIGEKLRNLSMGFFKTNDPGDVTSRMLHDVAKAEETLSHNITDYINGLIIPILIGGFLSFINWKLGLFLFISVIVALLIFSIGRMIIFHMGKKHLESINQASSRILEYASSIKVLKSFNMIGNNFVELDKAMLKLKKLSFQTEVWTGIPVQIALLVLDFAYLCLILLSSMFCLNNTMSIPELFSFTILGYYFFEPIKQLGITTVLMRHAKNSTDRIINVLEEKEQAYKSDSILPDKFDLSFENVNFKYKDNLVLNQMNCYIPEKSMTALVGLSGSGKTTMTSLIARFWDCESGRILCGSENINDFKPDNLLTKISMVFQDVFLFNDTIANNIRIGNQNASEDEIINAAKLAQCHEFITLLPKGYQTVLSEAGKSLSGGEKQRISIARAILKNAPLILLDEATASLDPENEYEIQKALDHLTMNKTLIVIAHKFSSIVNANQILVIENGCLVEKGTHNSLLEKRGLYSKLWDLQQKSGTWKMKA